MIATMPTMLCAKQFIKGEEERNKEFYENILSTIFILLIVVIIYYRNDIINYIYNKVYCKKKDDKSK